MHNKIDTYNMTAKRMRKIGRLRTYGGHRITEPPYPVIQASNGTFSERKPFCASHKGHKPYSRAQGVVLQSGWLYALPYRALINTLNLSG